MNYKKEIPNVEWGNARAAKDMFASQYVDQDIQQWPQLPADKMVPGFAAGMDDLAQIVLNNKFKTKFNRNALTLPGAEDWVAKKNRTIKDPSVLSHQMVFFECLLSKSRRPFQFILTFCIRTEKVEQK